MPGQLRLREACLLCGAVDQATAFLVVRWLHFEPGHEYSAIDRCRDRAGCRARVEGQLDEAGKPRRWELADGEPAVARASA